MVVTSARGPAVAWEKDGRSEGLDDIGQVWTRQTLYEAFFHWSSGEHL